MPGPILSDSSTMALLVDDVPLLQLTDTVIEAEQLWKYFLSFITEVAEACTTAVSSADGVTGICVDHVKSRIALFFQFQSTTEMQTIVRELDTAASTHSAVMQFLTDKHLLGYLNHTLLKYIYKSILAPHNQDIVEKIDQFYCQHETFVKRHSLKNLATVFLERPRDLSPFPPASIVACGLPKAKLTLDTLWAERSLHQLNNLLQLEIGIQPEHLIVESIEKKYDHLIISYAVLPFFLSTVSKQLIDEAVIKAFANANALCTMDEDTLKMGTDHECNHIDLIIREASAMIQVFGDSPLGNTTFSVASLHKVRKSIVEIYCCVYVCVIHYFIG